MKKDDRWTDAHVDYVDLTSKQFDHELSLVTQAKGGLRSLTLPFRCCQWPRQRDCWARCATACNLVKSVRR
jgi:hypothetical protein